MIRSASRRVSTAVWAVSLALALTGCSSQGSEVAGNAATSGVEELIDADWSSLGDHGYIYLQANTDGRKHFELLRADLASGEVDQITDVSGPFGVSNFSVSRAGLVVADASSLSDEAVWLRSDGGLDRLPGPRVLGPAVNERGDVLASIPTGRSEALAILPAGESRWRRVVEGLTGWTVSWWFDADTAIVLTIGRRHTTWTRIDADGRRGQEQPIAEGVFFPGMVTRHNQAVVMAARGGDTGLLWRPGQSPRRLPDGWEHGCVSPDGKRLLLMSHRRLGVLDVDDLDGPVRELGGFTTSILGCGWVDERFGP